MQTQRKVCAVLISLIGCGSLFSQNAGINADGSTPESGVMLDVKGSNSKTSTTALQNIFQIKSNDASSDALKLRLGLATNSGTPANQYGTIDVPEFSGGSVTAYRHLALQPLGGNVGIGKANPATKLVVAMSAGNGSAIFGGGVSLLDLQGSTANFSEPEMIFTESGNVIASISAKNSANYIGALIFSTNNTSLAAAGDVERMRILGNGNVGIGTINPGALLEVAGQVKITGGTPGTGKVLTSDNAGLASWANGATTSGSGFIQLIYNDETTSSGTSTGLSVKTYTVTGTYSQVKVEVDIEADCQIGGGVAPGWAYSILYNGGTVRTAKMTGPSASANWATGSFSYTGTINNNEVISIDIPSKFGINGATTWYVKSFRVYAIY
jgi:hypothetical protein